EFIRLDLSWPGRFHQLTSAHALRLVTSVLRDLGRADVLKRLEPRMRQVLLRIQATRNPRPPYFGDDFWDWAYIIQAMRAMQASYPDIPHLDAAVEQEIDSYVSEVRDQVREGLTFGGDGEWFGPATAAAAAMIVGAYSGQDRDALLA